MKFAKIVFLVAGIYGLLVISPLYFSESQIGRSIPPPIAHAEFFYGFAGVTLAWQILFLVLAQDPVRFRPMMLPALLEKVSYGTAVVVLYLQHRTVPFIFGFGLVDLTFAVLFAISYVRTPVTLGDAKQAA